MNGSLTRTARNWTAGIVVSTPIIAILQGSLLLYDYRSKHGDAPRPDVPSSGIVAASSNPDASYLATTSRRKASRTHEAPLRLLVIGDSLAAGVGIRESSTPILPASIAQALSHAMGGRPVYWTCVGTPGVSSSLLVHDIYQLDENESSSTCTRQPQLLQRWSEWRREQRRKAQERLEAARKSAREWWEHRDDEKGEVSKDETTTKRPFPQWIQQRMKRVRRDVDGLVRVMRALNPRNEQASSGSNLPVDAVKVPRQPTLTRHPTVDPKVVGPYDIAIVLTGLNDLKDAFLPFMMSAQNAQRLHEEGHGERGSGAMGAFIQILHALKDKMNLHLPDQDVTSDENTSTRDYSIEQLQSRRQRQRAPLVVFPALPISPLEMCRTVPLSWFLVPLIRAMDNNKRLLAEMYPGLVVFVDAPSTEVLSQVEARRGPLWENLQKEQVLLKLTDVVHTVRDRVEGLMKDHYQSWFLDAEDVKQDDEEDEFRYLYQIELDGVSPLIPDPIVRHPGASMVSCDGVHPSDSGYEFWGRFIAAEIIKHLDLKQI